MRTTHRCLRPAGALVALLALLAIPLLAAARTAKPTLTPEQRARFADAATDPALPAWQREVLAQLGEGAMGASGAEAPFEAAAVAGTDGRWMLMDPFAGSGSASLVHDAERDRLLYYNGTELWELPLAGTPRWSRIAPFGAMPPARYDASVILDTHRQRLVVFGGSGAGGARLSDVWAFSLTGGEPGWSEITFAPGALVPEGRYAHSAIYDPVRDRMVVFGGYGGSFTTLTNNDLWTLTFADGAWHYIVAPPMPAERANHVAIYDPVRDRMIVHGGETGYSVSSVYSDCWAFSLAGAPAWTQLTPVNTLPGIRSSHAAVYDPAGDRMVVFGGGYYGVDVKQDVWSLALSGTLEWTEWVPDGEPGLRNAPAGAYDATRHSMVIAGGGVSSTFSLSLDDPPAWSLLAPGPSIPAIRSGHSAIVDPVGDRMIVFGGFADGAYRDDLWSFSFADPTTWVALAPSGTLPGPRSQHTAVYDPVRQRMLVFGGYDGTSLNDLWSLSLTGELAWTQLAPTGASPEARRGHSAIYDAMRDRMIVFGGQSATARLADTWELSLSEGTAWGLLTPLGTPPTARMGHSAIFDPLRQRMIVFGGFTGSYRNDTWSLFLGAPEAWSQLTPAGTVPVARRQHAAVYDEQRDRMVVSWGFGTGNVYLGDLEGLDLSGGTTWSALLPPAPDPIERYGHSAVYDAVRDRMVTFGGFSGTGYFGDLWSLNWANTVSVEPSPVATSLGLAAPVPNPFRAATALRFALPRAGRVSLTVHDLSGRVVRRLVDGERAAGPHTERWDGLDARGTRVGAGVYFVHLAGPGVGGTKRVVLLH